MQVFAAAQRLARAWGPPSRVVHARRETASMALVVLPFDFDPQAFDEQVLDDSASEGQRPLLHAVCGALCSYLLTTHGITVPVFVLDVAGTCASLRARGGGATRGEASAREDQLSHLLPHASLTRCYALLQIPMPLSANFVCFASLPLTRCGASSVYHIYRMVTADGHFMIVAPCIYMFWGFMRLCIFPLDPGKTRLVVRLSCQVFNDDAEFGTLAPRFHQSIEKQFIRRAINLTYLQPRPVSISSPLSSCA